MSVNQEKGKETLFSLFNKTKFSFYKSYTNQTLQRLINNKRNNYYKKESTVLHITTRSNSVTSL